MTITHRVSWTAAAFAGVCAISATAWAQAQAPAAPNPKIETFATLPSAEGTENICQAADGAMYVTLINAKQVLKVTSDGKVSEFAGTPDMTNLLGVACGDGAIVTTAMGKSFRKQGATPAFDFSDVDPHIVAFDASGKQTADIAGVKGQAFNGIISAGNGKYYAADSNSGAVWIIDVANKTIEPVVQDDMLKPGGDFPIGANGVKVHDGWLYVTTTGTGTIFRVKLGADGKGTGALEKFATGARFDDFDIASDGTIYLTSGPVLYKVTPAGELVQLEENVPGGPAMLVGPDGKYIYWPTRGGSDPQRIVRYAIQ